MVNNFFGEFEPTEDDLLDIIRGTTTPAPGTTLANTQTFAGTTTAPLDLNAILYGTQPINTTNFQNLNAPTFSQGPKGFLEEALFYNPNLGRLNFNPAEVAWQQFGPSGEGRVQEVIPGVSTSGGFTIKPVYSGISYDDQGNPTYNTSGYEGFKSEIGPQGKPIETTLGYDAAGNVTGSRVRFFTGDDSGVIVDYDANGVQVGAEGFDYSEQWKGDLARIMAVVGPALGPYGALINAGLHASQGNWLSALTSALNAGAGFSNAATAIDPISGATVNTGTFLGLPTSTFTDAASFARIGDALSRKDWGAFLQAVGNSPLTSGAADTQIGSTGFTLSDAAKGASALMAVSNGQYGQAIASLGDLTKSKDTVVAGRALALWQAIDSGKMGDILRATGDLSNALSAYGTGASSTTTQLRANDPTTVVSQTDAASGQYSVPAGANKADFKAPKGEYINLPDGRYVDDKGDVFNADGSEPTPTPITSDLGTGTGTGTNIGAITVGTTGAFKAPKGDFVDLNNGLGWYVDDKGDIYDRNDQKVGNTSTQTVEVLGPITYFADGSYMTTNGNIFNPDGTLFDPNIDLVTIIGGTTTTTAAPTTTSEQVEIITGRQTTTTTTTTLEQVVIKGANGEDLTQTDLLPTTTTTTTTLEQVVIKDTTTTTTTTTTTPEQVVIEDKKTTTTTTTPEQVVIEDKKTTTTTTTPEQVVIEDKKTTTTTTTPEQVVIEDKKTTTTTTTPEQVVIEDKKTTTTTTTPEQVVIEDKKTTTTTTTPEQVVIEDKKTTTTTTTPEQVVIEDKKTTTTTTTPEQVVVEDKKTTTTTTTPEQVVIEEKKTTTTTTTIEQVVVTTDRQTTTTPAPTTTPRITSTTARPTTARPEPPTGFTWPQAQAVAAALGIPGLANVFYYGKEFGSKKQKLTKEGTVKAEKYKPLSVVQPGAEPEQALEALEEAFAPRGKSEENEPVEAAAGGYLDYLLRQGETPMTEAELLEIIRKG
jgi:hypothetical protein